MPPGSSKSNDGGLKFAFTVLIVPLAVMLRVLGVDPMGVKRTKASTYWKRRRKGVRMTSQF
jgi:hypothetical protein